MKKATTTQSGGRRAETGERRTEGGEINSRFHLSPFILHPSAFSLVEVTLALGLAGFCLVALLGLIPAGMRNASVASEQTVAVGLLGAIVADLRGTPETSDTSPRFGVAIPPSSGSQATSTNYFSEDGQTNSRSQSRYAVETTLTPQANDLVGTRVLIYWPAAAAPASAKGSVESVTVLDRK